MAAELPISSLTPKTVEGLIRSLVHLGDVTKRDLANDAGWSERTKKCSLAQALHITVDKSAARQQILEAAASKGIEVVKQSDEMVVLGFKIAGQDLKVVARPMPLVVSFIAYLGGVAPKGDTRRYMERMLELNRAANVPSL